jgi:hypothetical protein
MSLQAGDREDIGALQGAEASQMVSGSAWSSEGLSNYLVCVVEQQDQADTDTCDIALVAVETSTGAVLYEEFK